MHDEPAWLESIRDGAADPIPCVHCGGVLVQIIHCGSCDAYPGDADCHACDGFGWWAVCADCGQPYDDE